MRKRKIAVKVNDLMQRNYVYYLTEPTGKNFHPNFKPQLTPRELLELGVFGGRYMTDCRDEFPASWFRKAKLCHEKHDAKLNFFKVHASQPLSVWKEQGWIYHEDPRGWFQWYCRYYMGRAALMMSVKSGAGARCGVMSRNCRRIVRHGPSIVVAGRDKRCCIGRTTRGRFERRLNLARASEYRL
jgi:hypothetical protein